MAEAKFPIMSQISHNERVCAKYSQISAKYSPKSNFPKMGNFLRPGNPAFGPTTWSDLETSLQHWHLKPHPHFTVGLILGPKETTLYSTT